mgnify:CR=1 FL=1
MPLPIATAFVDLPDSRLDTPNKLHRLIDLPAIATCAVIGGGGGWEQVAEYGQSREAFFRRFLALPNGIPNHDTFYRVFTRLNPDAFADRFGKWTALACEATGLAHVAVSGHALARDPHLHHRPGTRQSCSISSHSSCPHAKFAPVTTPLLTVW